MEGNLVSYWLGFVATHALRIEVLVRLGLWTLALHAQRMMVRVRRRKYNDEKTAKEDAHVNRSHNATDGALWPQNVFYMHRHLLVVACSRKEGARRQSLSMSDRRESGSTGRISLIK
jgi:hypothetical protein